MIWFAVKLDIIMRIITIVTLDHLGGKLCHNMSQIYQRKSDMGLNYQPIQHTKVTPVTFPIYATYKHKYHNFKQN